MILSACATNEHDLIIKVKHRTSCMQYLLTRWVLQKDTYSVRHYNILYGPLQPPSQSLTGCSPRRQITRMQQFIINYAITWPDGISELFTTIHTLLNEVNMEL